MPENSSYMFAAYVAAALVIGGYVLSLVIRARAMAKRGAAIDSVTRQ
jgi:CcmD family protein